jgi:hypothetical protein
MRPPISESEAGSFSGWLPVAPRLKLLVAVHLALAAIPAGIGLVPPSRWGLLVINAIISIPIAQLMLLGFWVVMGTAAARHRLLSTWSAVAYGACWLVVSPYLSPYYRAPPMASVLAGLVIGLALGLSCLAVCSGGIFLLIQCRGTELRRVSDREAAPARLQYSVVHALVITSVVAVLLGLARGARATGRETEWNHVAAYAMIALVVLVNLVCATWAVLAAGRIRLRISLVLLLTVFLGVVVPLSFHHGELSGWWRWVLLSEALAIVLPTLIVIASMLVVRSCGYRLLPKATAHA